MSDSSSSFQSGSWSASPTVLEPTTARRCAASAEVRPRLTAVITEAVDLSLIDAGLFRLLVCGLAVPLSGDPFKDVEPPLRGPEGCFSRRSAGGIEHVPPTDPSGPAAQLGQGSLVLLYLGEGELFPRALAVELVDHCLGAFDQLLVLGVSRCVVGALEFLFRFRRQPLNQERLQAPAGGHQAGRDPIQVIAAVETPRQGAGGGTEVDGAQAMEAPPSGHAGR